MLTFKIIEHQSDEYQQTVELRYQILREPLGLTFAPEQLQDEHNQYHIAGFETNPDSQQKTLVCCLLFEKIDDQTLKMRQVAVKTDKQGQGIGKKLVDFAEQFARHHQYKRIVMSARLTAVPFYKTRQYAPTGLQYEEVGLEHFKMEKQLP